MIHGRCEEDEDVSWRELDPPVVRRRCTCTRWSWSLEQCDYCAGSDEGGEGCNDHDAG